MRKENLKISELYDLSHSMAGQWLSQFTYPWEALSGISAMIRELGEKLPATSSTVWPTTCGCIKPQRWPPPLIWAAR